MDDLDLDWGARVFPVYFAMCDALALHPCEDGPSHEIAARRAWKAMQA